MEEKEQKLSKKYLGIQQDDDWLNDIWVCPNCGNTGNWRKGEDYEIWHIGDKMICCKCWYSEQEKNAPKN